MTPDTDPRTETGDEKSPMEKRDELYAQLKTLADHPDTDEIIAQREALFQEAEAFYTPFKERVLPLVTERLDAQGFETEGRKIGFDITDAVAAWVFRAAEGYLDRVTPALIDRVIKDLEEEEGSLYPQYRKAA